jgi:DNA/RNA endonuclease YhcR with UshA esterase domain
VVRPSAQGAVRVWEIVPSEQAREHIGVTNTVCGVVASARYLDREREKPTFLNFDHPYPNQTFTVRIPGASRAAFNEPPEVLFPGKTVCVTGLIVEYRGKPEIVVGDPYQIVVQEATPDASHATTNTNQKTPTPASEATTNTSPKPSTSPLPSATTKGIPSAEAHLHIGETTTVCGSVAGARYFKSREGGHSLLNFDHPYPNHTLTVMIEEPNRAKFSSPPEVLFGGKTVCVTGRIAEYRGKPEIVVDNPSQIVIQE